MNSRERMCRVLNHELPDRVPTFKYAIDKQIVEALCPNGTYADVVEHLGLDAITAWEPSTGGYVPGLADKLKPGDLFIDEWKVKRKASGEMSAYPLEEEVPIRDEGDLKNFTPPNPNSETRYEILRKYLMRFGGEKRVSYAILDMFEISKCLMGLEKFLISFSQRPKLIKAIFEMTTNWVIEVANKAIDIGADMIIDASDVGYKNGLWVKPELMEEFSIPCLKRIADAVKKRRAYIFYHSHGNIWALIAIRGVLLCICWG